MLLSQNERLDDLGLGGLRLIQDKTQFCFGVDAVLLSAFARVKYRGRALDLGCGNGIIPLLLSHKTKASLIAGVEIQSAAASLARRNVELNGLSSRVKIIEDDLKNVSEAYFGFAFDTVVSNPPYMEPARGEKNASEALRLARHEIACNAGDVIAAASRCLKFGGLFFMIHRPERIADILTSMRECGLEPKRLRAVHPKAGQNASMILIEGQKGAHPYCVMAPPLYIHGADGGYTDEINAIYERA
ncbi:MAG: tRNA1(Val) (adenine(37)-N6)-methyltransferase [Clostridia bacterium]|nr:tRNA1(Val) (adenine(37)-N6)-methyltransferase [Clostridia bacterium]